MTLRLNGATSGSVSLDAPATGSNVSLELPTDSIKPGMVLVAAQSFSAVSSVSVNNCFTATYTDYFVMIRAFGSTTTEMFARFRTSGTDNTTAAYAYQSIVASGTSVTGSLATGDTKFRFGTFRTSFGAYGLTIYSPQVASTTTDVTSLGNDQSGLNLDLRSTCFQNNASFDGITVYPNSGTATGSIRIYGIRSTV